MSVSSATEHAPYDLGEFAALFQIPKAAGRLKIKSNAIAVASTGATGIIERHGQFYVKVLVLEGTVRCYLTNRLGESLLLQPGQILITKPDVTALPGTGGFRYCAGNEDVPAGPRVSTSPQSTADRIGRTKATEADSQGHLYSLESRHLRARHTGHRC